MTHPVASTTGSAGDTLYNVRDAALKGASSAFGKPHPPPKPLANTYSGLNGALAAATSVAAPPKHNLSTLSLASQEARPPLDKQSTGNSVRSSGSVSSPSVAGFGPGGRLSVPQAEGSRSRSKSPSNIAATLAAARHHQMASKSTDDESGRDVLPTAGTVKARLSVFGSSVQPSSTEGYGLRHARATEPAIPSTHPTSSAPTSLLAKAFAEAGGSARPGLGPRSSTAPSQKKQPPPIKGPKPKLPGSNTSSVNSSPSAKTKPPVAAKSGPPIATKPRVAAKRDLLTGPTATGPALRHLTKARASGPRRTAKRSAQPASSPTKTTKITKTIVKNDAQSGSQQPRAPSAVSTPVPTPKEKPVVPSPRRGVKQSDNSPSVNATPVLKPPVSVTPLRLSPLSLQSPQPPTPESRRSPAPPISSSYKRESSRRIEPHLTGDSLANAIVGAHIASSRATSPTRQTEAPPLPKRHNHAHILPFHISRSPSPTKGIHKPIQLKHTMRKPNSESSEDESVGRKHFLNKHPNKHREGSRKRWRDRVTERERKRYEGVWAANKNIYLPIAVNPSAPIANSQEDVGSLVVRDIWSRSRLPENVLEEVWDLVDSRGVGRLSREEFVVGLWLVDQRLKGRKLPQRVSESVWDSVTGVGMKVRRLK